jgi:hypothetical protein
VSSLLIAVLTATFFAVFGFPYLFYHYWFSWDRWGTVAGSTLYLLLAGVGGGLLGWSTAYAASAKLSDQFAVQGVLSGILGTLAMRADFGTTRARPTPPGTDAADARGALSLLGASLTWTTSLLDHRAGHQAERWYRALDDDALLLQAWDVYVHILDCELPARAKRELQKRLSTAMSMVRAGCDKTTHDEGRALVVQFCVSYSGDQHLAKPAGGPLSARAPAAGG